MNKPVYHHNNPVPSASRPLKYTRRAPMSWHPRRFDGLRYTV